MNRGLRKNGKNDFEKDFFNLMNNAVFGETMESVRKHRDIKLVTTKTRINYLVSEKNFHKTIFFFFFFFRKFISSRNEKNTHTYE